jgi:hypothetical protein
MLNFIMHHSAEVGLLLFLLSFILISVFAITRTRKELDRWASLPLGGSATTDSKQEARP